MQKNKKGSILVYSIIILAMMFSIIGVLSSISVIEKKSVGSSQASSQAYQSSDSGAKKAIKNINAVLTSQDNLLSDAFGLNCSVSSGKAVVKDVIGSNNIPYELTFYSQDGSAIGSCSESVTSIKNIKSVAVYKNTARAVSVTVGSVDSFTKLLLHADGQNNSVNFLDSSFYEKQVTAQNGANLATNKKMFGSASARFDGVNDYLELSASDDWNFGTEDFTIEFWILNSSNNSRQHALSFGSSTNNIDFDFNDPDPCQGSQKGIWVYWNSGGGNAICAGNRNQYTDNNWHHIAFLRKNNVMKLYVDGSQVGSDVSYTDPINLNVAGAKFRIGATSWDSIQYFWKGNIDELRVSKGIARDIPAGGPKSPY